MRFAISIPNFGAYAEPSRAVDLAVTAESAGWDGFFLWDHIVIADGVPVADPWVVLGAIAQATSTITIGPMVAALPRHRPWVVARQSVSLDRLSGGRMILGVGIGTPPAEEFGTFGDPEDARVRADMLDEGLEIIQGVWSGNPFAFSGKHYSIKETTFGPTPLNRIPIWVAAVLPAKRPLRRAARFDGAFPLKSDFSELSVEEVMATCSYIEAHRGSDGQFDFMIGGPPQTEEGYATLEQAGVTWYLTGPYEGDDPDETLDWVASGPGAYTR